MKQRVEEVMAVFLLPIEDNLSAYASCLFDNVLLGIVMRNYYAAEVIPLNSLMVIYSWLYDARIYLVLFTSICEQQQFVLALFKGTQYVVRTK